MCIGKVLIGGYMIFFVVFVSDEVVDIIFGGYLGVFMYGFIFMGNLLVCVVVKVFVELLFLYSWEEKVKVIEL